MKKLPLLVALCVFPATAVAQQRVSNDLISYLPPPANWQKEVKAKTYTSYGIVAGRKYCQIFVLLGTNSKGSIAKDFESDWQGSIVSSYAVTGPPQLTETATEPGWQARTGVGSFEYSGGMSAVMLVTITGYGRSVAIVAVTNSEDYTPHIQSVLASVKMNQVPATASAPPPTAPPAGGNAQPTALQGYMEYNPFTQTWTWKVRYPPPK
jgi:hypothetical protein